MIARRQVVQSLLSLVASLVVSPAAQANVLSKKLPFQPAPLVTVPPPLQDEPYGWRTVIKVIGVGGCECNALAHLIASETHVDKFIVVDVDASLLTNLGVHKTMQLGTSGCSWSGNPDLVRAACQMSREKVCAFIEGAHMPFIVAGMGRGTGTGAGAVIARVAREMSVVTVGVVTTPFNSEGDWRAKAADGLSDMQANVDSLILVPNDKIIKLPGDSATPENAYIYVNELVNITIREIESAINVPGQVNIDFEDLCNVLSEPCYAGIGSAKAAGENRARTAAEHAMESPLMKGLDLSDASGVLVLISGATGTVKLSESKLAMNTIRAKTSRDALIVYGTSYDDKLGDQIRVTLVAAGFAAD